MNKFCILQTKTSCSNRSLTHPTAIIIFLFHLLSLATNSSWWPTPLFSIFSHALLLEYHDAGILLLPSALLPVYILVPPSLLFLPLSTTPHPWVTLFLLFLVFLLPLLPFHLLLVPSWFSLSGHSLPLVFLLFLSNLVWLVFDPCCPFPLSPTNLVSYLAYYKRSLTNLWWGFWYLNSSKKQSLDNDKRCC